MMRAIITRLSAVALLALLLSGYGASACDMPNGEWEAYRATLACQVIEREVLTNDMLYRCAAARIQLIKLKRLRLDRELRANGY